MKMMEKAAIKGSRDVAIMRPERPQRLGDEVYGMLYARLMSLDIAPGGRISIDNLVREFGVSQTPIREALSRLEAQGLVVKKHMVGYSAASQLDLGKVSKLFDLRSLLEPYAAEHAALNISDEEISTLTAIDSSMQTIVTSRSRREFLDFAQSDGQLHDLIAVTSGNEFVRDGLARLHTHVHLFRLYYLASEVKNVNAEHAEIVDAICRRDGIKAAKAMKAHIEHSRRRFAGG
jgi:DNA-binding GntR family transcriptional regulator